MYENINKNINRIEKKLEEEIGKELLMEFKKVDSNENLDVFFKKFLTSGEKDVIFRRIAIIKFLNQGKTYRDIKKILRVSDNTISKSVDIMAGRDYGQNPDRERKFSKLYIKQKPKKTLRYKGAKNILEILTDI